MGNGGHEQSSIYTLFALLRQTGENAMTDQTPQPAAAMTAEDVVTEIRKMKPAPCTNDRFSKPSINIEQATQLVRDYAAQETAGLEGRLRKTREAYATTCCYLDEAREQLAAVRAKNARLDEALYGISTSSVMKNGEAQSDYASLLLLCASMQTIAAKALAPRDAATETKEPKYEEYKTVIESRDFEKHPISAFNLECLSRANTAQGEDR